MNWLLEYFIVFLGVFVFNYFMICASTKKFHIPEKCNSKKMPTELLYLKKIYHVDIKKIPYKQFVYIYCLINTFIISTIYMILIYLLDNWIMRIILGIILLILMIIICYGLLARYYLKKEGK